MNRSEVTVPAPAGKFDAEANLTDQPTRDFIGASLATFRAWVLRLR